MFELPMEETSVLLISEDQSIWTLFGEIKKKEMFELVHLLQELNALPTKERPKQIKFILNSVGGDLYSALPLYDAMLTSKIPIWLHATGNCFSAATILMCAAKKRTASPSTRFMIHDLAYGFDLMSIQEAKQIHTDMQEYSKLVKEIYTTKTKMSVAVVTGLFESGKDNYFWATTAVEVYGLIEEVC